MWLLQQLQSASLIQLSCVAASGSCLTVLYQLRLLFSVETEIQIAVTLTYMGTTFQGFQTF